MSDVFIYLFIFKIVYIGGEVSWALVLNFQMRIWILNELPLPEAR